MIKQRVVLGIDIGTSGTKVIAVSLDGSVVASATSTYDMMTPRAGWAEQNPNDWWSATIEAVREVVQRAGDIDVQGIGLSGQMHGLVPLDKAANVIRPALIWCDLRSEAQALELERTVGREEIIHLTQNPPLPNFTLTKVLWMKENEPDLYAKIDRVLLPKDYVRYRLANTFAMDATDASGTLLFDVANRRWSKDMCKAAGVPDSFLPEVYESNEIAGHLTVEAGALLGLPSGIPVVAGAGDQAAGAIGLGVVEPGTISSVFGTSGVVLAVTDRPVRDAAGRLHTFCHAERNSWFVMGVTQAAGGSLQWYRNTFAQLEGSGGNHSPSDVYTSLVDQAGDVPPGAEGLLFLPYLMGERSPHLNPQARGAWIGLQWRHQAAHLVRAVLEGVAFSLRDCFEVMREMNVTASRWKVSGGGAQSRVWMDIFASVMNEPLEIVQASHGPAYGAAILAAQGIGQLADTPDAVRAWVGSGSTVQPQADWVSFYQKLYPLFRSGYRLTEGLSADLNDLAGRAQV